MLHTTLENFCKEADKYIANQEYQKAIDVLDNAKKINALDPTVMMKQLTAKGLQSAKEKKWDDAVTWLNRAAKVDPRDPEPHCRIAKIHEDKKEFDLAEKEYHIAMQIRPDTITQALHASFLKKQIERFKKEKDVFRTQMYAGLYQEALIQIKTYCLVAQKESLRLQEFHQALQSHHGHDNQFFPPVTPARLKQSAEFCMLACKEEAQKAGIDIHLFTQALSFCPYNLTALECRGMSHAGKGNTAAAMQDFNQIIKLNATDVVTAKSYFHLTLCYIALSRHDHRYLLNARFALIRYMMLDVHHQGFNSIAIDTFVHSLSYFEKYYMLENTPDTCQGDYVEMMIDAQRKANGDRIKYAILMNELSTKVTAGSKEDAKIALSKANIAFQEKKFAIAIFHYTQAICHEQRNAILYRQRGLAYLALNQDQEALENFIIAAWMCINGLSHDPDYKIYEYVAIIRNIYLKKDCFEESILGHLSVRAFVFRSFLDEVITHLQHPSISVAEQQLRLLKNARNSVTPLFTGYHGQQKLTDNVYTEEIESLEQQFNISKNFPDPFKKKINKSIDDAKETLKKLDEEFSQILTDKATQKRDEKNYDAAILCYNRAIDLNGANTKAIVGRAMTYLFMNKYEEALIDFRKASLLQPLNLELDALYRDCYTRIHGAEKEMPKPKRRPKKSAPSTIFFQPRPKPKVDAEAKKALKQFWIDQKKAAAEEQKRAEAFLEKQKNEKNANLEKARIAANESTRKKRRERHAAKIAVKDAKTVSIETPATPIATPAPIVAVPSSIPSTIKNEERTVQPVFNIVPTDFEKLCLSALKAVGNAYIVGGSVLSRLELKQICNPKADIDIVTSASPDAIKFLFKHFNITQDLHNTNRFSFTWAVTQPNGELKETKVEIWHSPKLGISILDEAKDRDFTINAFYMDEDGNVFSGTPNAKDHLTDHCIHTIIDANESLLKDPIRILRALDLSSKTGKNLSKELEAAVKTHCPELKKLNEHRLNSQILKFLSNSRADFNFLKWLDHSVIPILFPEMANELKQDKNWIVDQLREIKSRDRGSSLNEIFQIFLTSFLKQRDPAFYRKTTRELIETNETIINDIMEKNILLKSQYRFTPNLNNFLSGAIEKRKQTVDEKSQILVKANDIPGIIQTRTAMPPTALALYSIRYDFNGVPFYFENTPRPLTGLTPRNALLPPFANQPHHLFAGSAVSNIPAALGVESRVKHGPG